MFKTETITVSIRLQQIVKIDNFAIVRSSS